MIVLDASAVLAFLQDEPGANVVEPALPTAQICAVNYSELLQKLNSRGIDATAVMTDLSLAGLTVEPFLAIDAEAAAALNPVGAPVGLSLADRACLALARRLGTRVMTADRAWAELPVNIDVTLIR